MKSTADIVAVFDDLAAKARASLEATNDEKLAGEWEMLFGENLSLKGLALRHINRSLWTTSSITVLSLAYICA